MYLRETKCHKEIQVGWRHECGCHQPVGPTQGTEPEEESAPGTQADNFHKEQLCRVCQGGKETVSPVAPGDSGMARGDITGRQSSAPPKGDGVGWHARGLEGNVAVPALTLLH